MVKRDGFPGPGTYKISHQDSSVKISCTRDKKMNKKDMKVPGPGFYKIPTSFDNINSVARSGGAFDPSVQYV